MGEVLNKFFSSSLKMLEEEMENLLSQFQLPLYNLIRYHLGWTDEKGNWLGEPERRKFGGKRIRPLMLLAINKLLGGSSRKCLPAASAVEFLHNFSLVHDDVEDGDEVRRFRPTVWKIWGVPQAVNLGSSMQAIVNLSALSLRQNFSSEIVIRVLEELTWAIIRMTEGQYLDLIMQAQEESTVSDYLDMVRKKTAALFERACRISAILADRKEEIVERAGKFGMFFGLAFQIKDDYLGIWGEPEKIGKPAEDIHKGKKSFPIVFALNKSQRREELVKIVGKDEKKEEDIIKAWEILDQIGARQYTREICESYADDAIFYLSKLGGRGAFRRELENWVRESLRIEI